MDFIISNKHQSILRLFGKIAGSSRSSGKENQMFNKKNMVCMALLIAWVNLTAQVDPGTHNLIHSWTFEDGTADDRIGGANGTLMGSARILQGSLETTVTGSWMRLPADLIAINTCEAVTIEAWFRPVRDGNTGYHMLAAFGNTQNTVGTDYFFMTPARGDDISRAAISCGVTDSPWSGESGANGVEYDDGLVHHMVSTIDSANITLYIDGALQASTPLAANNSIARISNAFAYLAKSLYDNDATWKGTIHEFNIYNTALSPENVLFLFENGKETFHWVGEESLKPVILEAESGDAGRDFDILQDDTVEYVTIQTDRTAFNPGSMDRIITYEVSFPDPGTYDLFVRLRVGPETWDDDSFFYGREFGEQDPAVDSLWVCINGLAAAGFSQPTDIVREAGSLGSGVWKWVNVSKSAGLGDVTTFTVADTLTQTFQIGGREDGLDIDKLAFGKSYLFYSVGNLDNREAGSTSIDEIIPAWQGPPLASNQPKFVGNVYSAPQIQNFEAYWNKVTPENAGKWGSVEGTRNTMSWTQLDAAYKLAKDNDFPFHFHVLIWGAQQPGWINSLEPAEQLEEIREWFEAVAGRYPDIDILEVVNEPLPGHNPPDGNSGRANYKEALGGDGETGWDWVLNSFRMAREIFPGGTKLMLNDFSIINSTSSTNTYLEIIRLLQAENLIDIIGEQGHAFTTTASSVLMTRNLDALAATGLPIHITELDIDGLSDAVQLQSYQRIFPTLYEHPGVEGITLWGWRRGLWRDAQGAYLLNQDGTERPALVWLRDYLDSVSVVMSVEKITERPNGFHLSNNYPNPFNPTTQILYSIPTSGHVTLKVYNLIGEEILTLVDERQSAGSYAAIIDGKNLASGIYLYQLNMNGMRATKRFTLLK